EHQRGDQRGDREHDYGFAAHEKAVLGSQFSVSSSRALTESRERELRNAFLFLCRQHRIRSSAILLQLVVQRLQADSENLGGAGLVVARRLQGFQDQLLLCFLDGRAHAQMYGVGIVHHRTNILSEAGWQMLRLDQTALAYDDSALESVAQLAHIAGPGITVK